MVPETSSLLYSCCMSGLSPPFPAEFDVIDFVNTRGPDQTTICLLVGGRRFDFVCSGSLFPFTISSISLRSRTLDKGIIFRELARILRPICGKPLIACNRENSSLMDFLHVWNVSARVVHRSLQLETPTRAGRVDEFFTGVQYQDSDLPWYEWEMVFVLERTSETQFLVSVDGRRFGCYVPEGALEYGDCSVFLEEVRAWKRITNTTGIPGSIARLSGLVYSRLSPSNLQAVLYEWVEPSQIAPTLSHLNVEEIPMEQRKEMLRQMESAIRFLHTSGASLTKNRCKGDITERINITAAGDVHLRTIHFGDFESYQGSFRFVPHKTADYQLLADLRRLFGIGPGGAGIVSKSEPFRFLNLPAELRNRIYEMLLVFPGYVRWLWGYRHQADASPVGLLTDEVTGRGLLSTSRQVRRESMSTLVSRNNLLLDAVWISSFLESSTKVDQGGRLECVMVSSYLKRITLSVTLTWQEEVTRQQAEGFQGLVKNCANLEHVDLFIFNRRAWYWEGDTLWADLKNLPGVHVQEHWDESTFHM